MKCPICNKEYTFGNICEQCGVPLISSEPSAKKPFPRGALFAIVGGVLLLIAVGVGLLFWFKRPKAEQHNWQQATCSLPKMCIECGLTEGEPVGEHEWLDGSCEEPSICAVCGVQSGVPTGHDWDASSCDVPRTCRRCGKTEGASAGHSWQDATCQQPETCEVCGATRGEPLDHAWKFDACDQPRVCERCGQTDNTTSGHDWTVISCTEPRKCTRCGAEEQEPVGHTWVTDNSRTYCAVCKLVLEQTQADSAAQVPTDNQLINLYELPISNHTGKLFYYGAHPELPAFRLDWNDLNTPGLYPSALDSHGNRRSSGICVDGTRMEAYSVSFRLNGDYFSFSGVLASSSQAAGSYNAVDLEKYIIIYGDGKEIYRSPSMTTTSNPVTFNINVSNVQMLTIEYPALDGSNDIIVVYDGKLSR